MDASETAAARVAVVGAGAWGTTLAALACHRGPTSIWAREEEVVAAIRDERTNPLFLPGHRLPEGLHASGEIEEVVPSADVVVVAVPAQHLRGVFRRVAPSVRPDATILSVVKGIERDTLLRMTEVIAEESDHPRTAIGVLSGPNVASEVIVGQPAATVVALADRRRAEAVQRRLMGPRFRVYTHDDVVGCEVSGAVKNVIAIAAGIADGLGLGLNTKAALLTRGLAELSRLGCAVGGRPLTFLGLAGNGDLVATCGSTASRNHRVGVGLGEGRSIEEIRAEARTVAEGVETTPAVLALARRNGVEMPIVQEVAAVIAGRRSPVDAVDALMDRPPRPEEDGA